MAMKVGVILFLVGASLACAGIRPSFWLSSCSWNASDILELAVTQDEAHFRVVATIKGGTQPGAIKIIPELAPTSDEHSLFKNLAGCLPFDNGGCYQKAPPIRDIDRLILFLRPGDQPAGATLLTSAIWLQDGVAYVFEQTFNPGPTHLEALFSASQRVRTSTGWWPVLESEPEVRADIARLLLWKGSFDHAVSEPNASARATELAQLVTSKDRIVVRNALEKLSAEGQAGADALLPLLDDEDLLMQHFQILDTIAATKARGIQVAPIIQREVTYWARTCDQVLDPNWARNYGEAPAFHYLRLVSALKTIDALGIADDLPTVQELAKLNRQCHSLSEQTELRNAIHALLAK
jgi:hypothetical protein